MAQQLNNAANEIAAMVAGCGSQVPGVTGGGGEGGDGGDGGGGGGDGTGVTLDWSRTG